MEVQELRVVQLGNDFRVEWDNTSHSSSCRYNLQINEETVIEIIEDSFYVIQNFTPVACEQYEIVVEVVNLDEETFARFDKQYERGNN